MRRTLLVALGVAVCHGGDAVSSVSSEPDSISTDVSAEGSVSTAGLLNGSLSQQKSRPEGRLFIWLPK